MKRIEDNNTINSHGRAHEDIDESPEGINILATNFSNAIRDTLNEFFEKEITCYKNSVRSFKQNSKSNTNLENEPWFDERRKALYQEYS